MSRVVSLVLLGASIVAMGVVMLLGTSAAVPYFGPTRPFLTLGGSPSPITVTVLTWFAAVAAGAGTLAGLHALRRGPFAAPRRLLLAGAVTACVFALLPPVASVDMLNYAIYGRIADLGRDPYVTTPLRLARTGDPVGALLPSGWQRVPTVYGPIATAVQWLAAHIGGNSMARILFLLKWANATAFIGTGLLLDRLARPDPARRVRACLLWTVNPIMLFWMVGSGHADALAVLFLVAAVYAARRSAFAGGMAAGASVAVKASFLFPAAGLVAAAWLSPARHRRAAAVAAGLLLVGGGGYVLAGPAALHSLNARLGRTKDRYLPVPEPVLRHHGPYLAWMSLLAVGLTAFLWWRSGLPVAFWRRTAAGASPGVAVPDVALPVAAAGGGPDHTPVAAVPAAAAPPVPAAAPPGVPSPAPVSPLWAVLPVAVLGFGTTLVSPLQYPWYDAMLLPLAALLPYRCLDALIVARGVMLAVMTLPGVRVNGYQHLGVRWADLVWLIVFVVAVWRASRDTTSGQGSRRRDRNTARTNPTTPRTVSTPGTAQP